jgi:hypothetical protein
VGLCVSGMGRAELGWTYSRERPKSGSVLSLAWTPDGTQLAGKGGEGWGGARLAVGLCFVCMCAWALRVYRTGGAGPLVLC